MRSRDPYGAVEQFYLSEDLRQTKTILLVVIAFCAFLVYGDYLNFGINSLFYKVFIVRTAFIFLSFGIIRLLNKVKNFNQYEWLVCTWCGFYILLSLYVNATRQADNINFSYIDNLVVFLIFIVFPGKLYMRGILSGCLMMGDFAIIMFLKSPVHVLALKTIGLSYFIAMILGIVMANKLLQFRCKQYYVFLQEQNMRKQLEKAAYTDFLTGAMNRRKFFQLGEHEFSIFKENGGTFSVIMLDLDFFKNLNDKFGHIAGDVFLKEITKTMIINKRSIDILGRLGGEEFALVLPGTKLIFAAEMAEKLRGLCENTQAFLDHQLLHTTVSIGVTEVWSKDKSFHDVLKRADDALYQAKRKGRNRVQLIEREA